MTPLSSYLRGASTAIPNPSPAPFLSTAWCEELGRRFLRPERPLLDHARQIVASHHRGWETISRDFHARRLLNQEPHPEGLAELWEDFVLEGMIPAGWLGDPRRTFLNEPREGDEGPWSSAPAPTSLEALVSLASDPEGIMEAETMAAEWRSRWSQFERHFLGSEEQLVPHGTAWMVARLAMGSRRRDWSDELSPLTFMQAITRAIDGNLSGDDSLSEAVRSFADQDIDAFMRGVASVWPGTPSQMNVLNDRYASSGPIGRPLLFRVPYRILKQARFFLEAARLGIAGTAAGQRVTLTSLRNPFEALLGVVWRGYLPLGASQGRELFFAAPTSKLLPPPKSAPRYPRSP